ncbi:hypothetical protein CVT25_002519, partial [Psilocybe cyanescens]
ASSSLSGVGTDGLWFISHFSFASFILDRHHPQAMFRPALRSSLKSLHRAAPSTLLASRLVAYRCLSDDVRSKLQSAVKANPVVLFMKGTPAEPQCGFSRAVVQILDLHGVPPEKMQTYNVLADEELRSGIKEFSEWPTVPQIYVNGEFVGGCDILIGTFIIGAGTHVGAAVAAKLHENGYRVALGSRNPKQEGVNDAYFYVKVDVQNRESIEAAFDIVVEKLGPVNVVVYNAASVASPPDSEDFLSLPVEAYQDSTSIGIGAFIAAKKSLASFRSDLHKENPKSFIVTGNLLPFEHYSPPGWYTLGAQKALSGRFIATASQSYRSENIQFYFATLVSKEGSHPSPEEFAKGAQAHADVYWELINSKKQADWNHQ